MVRQKNPSGPLDVFIQHMMYIEQQKSVRLVLCILLVVVDQASQLDKKFPSDCDPRTAVLTKGMLTLGNLKLGEFELKLYSWE